MITLLEIDDAVRMTVHESEYRRIEACRLYIDGHRQDELTRAMYVNVPRKVRIDPYWTTPYCVASSWAYEHVVVDAHNHTQGALDRLNGRSRPDHREYEPRGHLTPTERAWQDYDPRDWQ